MKKAITSLLFIFISCFIFAQNNTARWLQKPAISPDGQEILFGYMGNIYKISAQGGVATALTAGDTYYTHPIWSHDGKTVAFSSDRYGNFDVYTMPANGGKTTRITYHSADDYAYDFTPDNKEILIGSRREAPAKSVRFPGVRYFQNLYTVSVDGGREKLITAAGINNARFNKDGSKIIFQNIKGYEDYYRKHEKAAITPDVWIYDIASDSYQQITNDEISNRDPHFGQDENFIFYTNEKSGDLNVYKKSIEGHQETQLTKLKDFPVRALSLSDNNKMAFSWKGDIYTLTEGQEPRKLNVQILNNSGYNTITHKKINSVTEFKLNPNGKEIAFVNRGEIFVTGVDNKHTKRVTNTAYQERMIHWSADGKSLIYSVEKDGSWNVYKVTLKHPEEKFFYASTTLNTEKLIASDDEEFQAKYSPDGKKIAYIKNRNILMVMNISTKEKTTILPKGHNFSYTDGDWDFEWSPDSKWLLVDDQKGYFSSNNTALISADGKGKITYPVNSGFGESDAKWALDGKMMTYKTTQHGRKSLAYQGSHEEDIYGIFFDQKAYDEYSLSEDDYKLFKARQKKDEDDKDEKDKKKKKKKDQKKDKVEDLKLDLNNLEYRKVRLTINSASISDYVLSKDGSKLYYLASFEKGYNLWVTEPRTHETKILAHLKGSPSTLQLSNDEKTIFLSKKGHLMKVDVKSGKVSSVPVNSDMIVDHKAERNYIFHHIWRQMKKRLYDPNLQGVDWEMYKNEYAKFLPYINNNYDFQILLSELLGEMNVSHSGGRYYPSHNNTEQTASLGALYDQKYEGEGIKITAILQGGPLSKAKSKAQKGDIITKINGEEIPADQSWYKYLTNLKDKNTRLTFKRGNKSFEETIKPISLSQENELMYKRWVDKMDKMVDSLSYGKIGYVHIKGMNDNSFRDVYAKALGKDVNKKALIVDTRFNGGGWLHNDLNTFLSGKTYLKFQPQGQDTKGGEPVDRWQKPSVVLMSEGNYSDAFIFPYIYKQNGIGKLVGMPVAGTGTAVWWERQIDPTIVFGIPMVATVGTDGKITENHELQPDIKVTLPYREFLNGEDAQLEAAVKEMLKEIED